MAQTKYNVVQSVGLASYEMSISINLAQRAFKELLKTCLGHHGLTIPQWTLLGKLYNSTSVRPTTISTLLALKPSYIAKLINELEKQGYIESRLFEDDGRGKALSLTKAGRVLVVQVEENLSTCLNEQLGDIKGQDLKTYFLLNSYIAQNVRHKNN